jgi:hypothetical protein
LVMVEEFSCFVAVHSSPFMWFPVFFWCSESQLQLICFWSSLPIWWVMCGEM